MVFNSLNKQKKASWYITINSNFTGVQNSFYVLIPKLGNRPHINIFVINHTISPFYLKDLIERRHICFVIEFTLNMIHTYYLFECIIFTVQGLEEISEILFIQLCSLHNIKKYVYYFSVNIIRRRRLDYTLWSYK